MIGVKLEVRARIADTRGWIRDPGPLGANVNRGGSYGQDVQRCENVQGSAQPDYWDVTYNFRGVEHRAQLDAPPGPTITVNGNGEPRG